MGVMTVSSSISGHIHLIMSIKFSTIKPDIIAYKSLTGKYYLGLTWFHRLLSNKWSKLVYIDPKTCVGKASGNWLQ